jgi:DNA-binding MarR family transcriptional regulator
MKHHRHTNSTGKTGQAVDFVQACKSMIAARAMSSSQFGSLCSDPAGDMLLDIYLRESAGQLTSLTSLRLAANSSEMTARTRLDALVGLGLVEREPHPFDRRSTIMRLTTAGREKLESCFRVLLLVLDRPVAVRKTATRKTGRKSGGATKAGGRHWQKP